MPPRSNVPQRLAAQEKAPGYLVPTSTRREFKVYLDEIRYVFKRGPFGSYLKHFDEIASAEHARDVMQLFFDKLTKEDLESRTVVLWGFEVIVMGRVRGMGLPNMNLKKYQPFMTLWLALGSNIDTSDFEGLVKAINSNTANYLKSTSFLETHGKILNYLGATVRQLDSLKALEAPSNWLTTHAARLGRVDLLKVLVENGYKVTDEAVKLLAKHGEYEPLSLALRNCECATTDAAHSNLLATAISGIDHQAAAETVRVLLAHGIVPNMDHMFRAVHNHMVLSLICDAMMSQASFLSELHGEYLTSRGSIGTLPSKPETNNPLRSLGSTLGTSCSNFSIRSEELSHYKRQGDPIIIC